MQRNKLKIFSGRSNPRLADNIAKSLDRRLGEISIRTFSDGEIWVKYEENIRGCDVFIIQSTNGPSENIMELALLVDAAVRACLLYTSPSPRDDQTSRMPSSA